MIRKPVVLITGAGGEIGHGLIAHFANEGTKPVVTLDVNPLAPSLGRMVQREFTGSIMDNPLLERVLSEFEVETVYHLAALLWPRFAVVLLYSALGTSLLVGTGLIAIQNGRPDWIGLVPSQTWAQVATLLGIVAFGAVVQWQLAPARPAPAAPKKSQDQE